MERMIFDQMKKSKKDQLIMSIHMHAYTFARQFIYNKKIIDAACGTCFGSMIFSTAAKSIIAVDKSKEAMEYGKKKLPFFCPVEFIQADLEKVILPKADVCVSIETIEHMKTNFFLKNLKVKQLIYTIPVNMGGFYHKIIFKDPSEIIKYLKESGWNTTQQAVVYTTSIGMKKPIIVPNFYGIAER